MEAGRLTDRLRSGITVRPTDSAGMKIKLSIKVRKSTEYNGDISYDGSQDYGGYTEEVKEWYR
jgi:hypothetical protein